AQEGLQEALAGVSSIARRQDPATGPLPAVEPDEPQSLHQPLVPQRCSPDRHLLQCSLEVVRPPLAVLVTDTVFSRVKKHDVPGHNLRSELLHIRDLALQVIQSVWYGAADDL